MKTPLSKCPADPGDTAERYCLDRLPLKEKKKFETHLSNCTSCYHLLQEQALYISAMQQAARDIGDRKS